VILQGNEYFLKKKCPDHGAFSTVIWRGKNPSYEEWGANYTPKSSKSNCPEDCGLCPGHLQKTCCALVEVTHRCNLRCSICFAGNNTATEPTLDELQQTFKDLVAAGNTFVQLSGGEPTMRDDLPDIIAAAKAAGCDTIQLNSNGIRLGADPAFTKELKKAGLSFVFMQFDGTEDAIYEELRGVPLLDAKHAAIRVCSENILGVTLVPTVVPGINNHNIGDIIAFGLKNSPAVRGIHFQPVSYFGRYPNTPSNKDRITLPEILHAIEAQTEQKFDVSDFAPSACDHPRCGFHGDFVVLPTARIMKLTKKNTSSCCDDDGHLKSRAFVSRRWTRSPESETKNDGDYSDMDTFLNRVKTHGFTITAMAFQDAYNLDIERLRRCSLHVAHSGKMIPFCAKYLTEVKI